MQFSEKGTMDPMNGHFSRINGFEFVNWIQSSLCGIPMDLIFARYLREIKENVPCSKYSSAILEWAAIPKYLLRLY